MWVPSVQQSDQLHTIFLRLFSLIGYCKIFSIYNNSYMLIPNSWFIPSPPNQWSWEESTNAARLKCISLWFWSVLGLFPGFWLWQIVLLWTCSCLLVTVHLHIHVRYVPGIWWLYRRACTSSASVYLPHVSKRCSSTNFGEGNGNPLQCSCLENPRDGGAWWAAVYGVAQSREKEDALWVPSGSSEECLVFLSPFSPQVTQDRAFHFFSWHLCLSSVLIS